MVYGIFCTVHGYHVYHTMVHTCHVMYTVYSTAVHTHTHFGVSVLVLHVVHTRLHVYTDKLLKILRVWPPT